MTESTLFPEDSTTTQIQEPAVPPAALTLPSEVVSLVGAGKKYSTIEDALKALPHAQAHIARIEEENKALREKAAQAKAIDEVYEALVSRQPEAGQTILQPVLDENVLDSVLERKLEQRRQEEVRTVNLGKVRNSLTEKFGEKAQEVFATKAKELGVNDAFLTDLAAKSPAAALELFGLAKKESAPTTAVSAGSINSQALAQGKQPAQVKPVMAGASTSDLLAAWRAVNPTNNT